ncbi:hypothetical protein [Streptomyces humidus]|uniref:hypothetical protein n=1 Tax=Streptomyces humidus TaxID=52259 RepID=UPI00332234A2
MTELGTAGPQGRRRRTPWTTGSGDEPAGRRPSRKPPPCDPAGKPFGDQVTALLRARSVAGRERGLPPRHGLVAQDRSRRRP